MKKGTNAAWKTLSFWRDAVEIMVFFLIVALGLLAVITEVVDYFKGGDAVTAEVAESAEDGVGRASAYLSGPYAEKELSVCAETNPRFEVYVEGEGVVPVWYRPEEDMAVEWRCDEDGIIDNPDDSVYSDSASDSVCGSDVAEPHPPEGIDNGGVDWNLCSSIVGWDGRLMEIWELDLLSRVFMREFWGTSETCCEAGIDAIINLWSTGLYGNTIGECLSARNDQGAYIYSVYPTILEGYYDPDGLAWCRSFCEERFVNGPEWECVYFRLGGYHDSSWTIPLYEIDGVFFSTGKEG